MTAAAIPGRPGRRDRLTAWGRVLVVGGLTSYRALFGWISPWILIPTFLVAPLAQILLFAYLGRAAGLGDDRFYVIGNALLYAAIPCVFATGNTIDGERQQQTLSLILATPAGRLALFLGRALPVILNGFLVSVFALFAGAALLRVPLPPATWLPLLVPTAAVAYSCTGLGMFIAAVALRVRETAVLSNLVYGVLLIVCGVNVPLTSMPGWIAGLSSYVPLTHGILAARSLAAGASLAKVGGQLGLEIAVGSAYLVAGLVLLRLVEVEARRRATLDAH
jgi:ABC-2 type transport system permease protein